MIKILRSVLIIVTAIIIITIGYFIYNIITQNDKLSAGELTNKIVLDTIPFSYASSGHIIIEAKVNGSKKPYPFYLDCGASNYLFSNHIDELNVGMNGRGLGKGSNGNWFLTKIRSIDSLQIGNLNFIDINAKEVAFDFNCTSNIYGLIGTGVMRHLVWQIDFENNIIIVSKSLKGLSFGENKIELPLSENKYSHHLSVKLKFGRNKKGTSVLVDIGNSGTLNLKEEHLLKDSLNFSFKAINGNSSEGLGGYNKSTIKDKFYLVDTLTLGYHSLNVYDFPIKTTPKGLNMLGLGFFKKYKTTISWIDRKLILEPYDSVQTFIWDTSGFSTKFDSNLNKVIINSILDNSAASRVNLPLNVEVISINEYVFSDEASLCNYYSAKINIDILKLKVRENGKIREYIIDKEPVFEIP